MIDDFFALQDLSIASLLVQQFTACYLYLNQCVVSTEDISISLLYDNNFMYGLCLNIMPDK